MYSWLPQIPVAFSGPAYSAAGIAVAIVLIARLSRGPNLDAYPTVGCGIVQEGYEKHKPAPFKVADMYGWLLILNSREHLEEVRKAPEGDLSFTAALRHRLDTCYTFGDEVNVDPYHLPAIRSQLTRNIATMYPEIRDEVTSAFEDILGLRGNEWKSVSPAGPREPWRCRKTHQDDLVHGAVFSLVARIFTAIPRDTVRGQKHVGLIIEERLARWKEYGNGQKSLSNDLISWFIEEADFSQLTVKTLTTRLLVVNFATIDTIGTNVTHALFYLAANPRYVQPLREEVEAIVEEEGWSKAAVGRMHKVDSFLKECQRMEGIFTLSIRRMAMKDVTLSDGTFIPKGTVISFPVQSLHYEEQFYEDAHAFEPSRFAEMQARAGDESAKYQFVSTGIDYLPFGHGKHACPDRFFAATELKTMFAHVVTTYDVRLEDGVTRPRSWRFADFILPNPHAKLQFRRRVD